jgi:hypothetical protein
MRSVAFDVRNVLRLNWCTNPRMLGPLPWGADGGVTPVTTNDRFALTTVGAPVPIATIATRSVPITSTGDPRMGTFIQVGQFRTPFAGGSLPLAPDWVQGTINISAYVWASRAATAVIGVEDHAGDYTSPTPWQSSSIAVPANTWTRISASGPVNIGDDPLNVNLGSVFINVTPNVGPPLSTDVVYATAAQVTAGADLMTYIDFGQTDQWRNVTREDDPYPQTGAITGDPLRGESVDFDTVDFDVSMNLVIDPRATTAARWTPDFATGGAGTETMVTGAADGPLLPDGTQATTYARYTVATANTAGTPIFGAANQTSDHAPVPVGTNVALAIYIRVSIAAPGGGTIYISQNLTGGTDGPNVFSANLSSISANTWTRRAAVIVSTATFVRSTVNATLSGLILPIGTTVDVTCALIEPGATSVPDHYDGATLDDATYQYNWVGTANASASTKIANVQSEQTNLIRNPRLVGLAFNDQDGVSTVTDETIGGPLGFGYRRVDLTTGNAVSPISFTVEETGTSGVPVVAGQTYIFSAYFFKSLTVGSQRIDIRWYDAAGVQIGATVQLGATGLPAGAWGRIGPTSAVAPALSAFVSVVAVFSGAYVPQILGCTGVLMQLGAVANPYFDGDFPPPVGRMSGWEGLRNASQSRSAVWAYPKTVI